MVHTYTYNNQHRLTDLTLSVSTVNKESYGYTLGMAGERTKLVETEYASPNVVRTVSYVYDHLYRLQNEVLGTDPASHPNIGYTLDTSGNRTGRTRNHSISGGPSATTSTFNQANLINEYSFDSQMNQTTSDYVSSVAGTDSYDYENHLTQRSYTGGGTVSIEYDAEGNRIKKTTSAGTIYYLTDDQNPTGYSQVVETRTWSGSAWSVQNRWVFGAMVISQSGSSGLQWYYGFDGHNNVRKLFDGSGALVGSGYTYDAFGVEWSGVTTDANPYRYCGEQWDSDLGLYFLRARYYNPQLGRFSGFDTYEGYREVPASLHRYAYCELDPINRTDPSGKWSNLAAQRGVAVHQYIGDAFTKAVPGGFSGPSVITILKEIGVKLPSKLEGTVTAFFPDLTDTVKMEVYEIKPDNVRSIVSGNGSTHSVRAWELLSLGDENLSKCA